MLPFKTVSAEAQTIAAGPAGPGSVHRGSHPGPFHRFRTEPRAFAHPAGSGRIHSWKGPDGSDPLFPPPGLGLDPFPGGAAGGFLRWT